MVWLKPQMRRKLRNAVIASLIVWILLGAVVFFVDQNSVPLRIAWMCSPIVSLLLFFPINSLGRILSATWVSRHEDPRIPRPSLKPVCGIFLVGIGFFIVGVATVFREQLGEQALQVCLVGMALMVFGFYLMSCLAI